MGNGPPLRLLRSAATTALFATLAHGSATTRILLHAPLLSGCLAGLVKGPPDCNLVCLQATYQRGLQLFRDVDADGDGFLREGEYEAMLQRLFGNQVRELQYHKEYFKMCGLEESDPAVGINITHLTYVFQHRHWREKLNKLLPPAAEEVKHLQQQEHRVFSKFKRNEL
mmetsp:Transcript_98207/g.227730  ORF Transcript_98207/g.227730 Transcript_98207/m.227730 type:complete len:169 (+) Transcript_98207:26-532(+)